MFLNMWNTYILKHMTVGFTWKKEEETMIHIFGIYDIWNTSNLSVCKAMWTKFLDGNKNNTNFQLTIYLREVVWSDLQPLS